MLKHSPITLEAFRANNASVHLLVEDCFGMRTPHATLILGPSGTGKGYLASLLAMGLLCSADANKPCGDCKSCKRCQAGTHSNLLDLTAGKNEKSIKIDQVRALQDRLSLHALETGRRVVLIREADTMTIQAQNALLKSLEEPDRNTSFMLTASNEGAVLPTILSRCRLVRMSPWPAGHVESILLTQGVPEALAADIAASSGGKPIYALQMYRDQRYQKLNSIIDNAFFSENLPIKIPWASATLRDHAADGDVLLDIFESRLARLMTEKVQNQPPTATAQPDDRWAAAKADAVRRIIQAVFEARKYRGSNVSWQSATDLLLLTISKEIFYADGHRRSV